MSVIGDIKNRVDVNKNGVTLHNFPQVLDTELAAATDTINIASKSGKRLGAQVMAVDSHTAPTLATIYVAAGNATTSKWVVVKQVIGINAVDVTPA